MPVFLIPLQGSSELAADVETYWRGLGEIIQGTYLNLIPDPMHYIIRPMLNPEPIGCLADLQLNFFNGSFYDADTLPFYDCDRIGNDYLVKCATIISDPRIVSSFTKPWARIYCEGWHYLAGFRDFFEYSVHIGRLR